MKKKYNNPLVLGKAVKLAIEFCRIYGFDFHTHVIHQFSNDKKMKCKGNINILKHSKNIWIVRKHIIL